MNLPPFHIAGCIGAALGSLEEQAGFQAAFFLAKRTGIRELTVSP
jgi:hypothetical protein